MMKNNLYINVVKHVSTMVFHNASRQTNAVVSAHCLKYTAAMTQTQTLENRP